eukprot:5311301-Pyramimonas_sp.AAC.1
MAYFCRAALKGAAKRIENEHIRSWSTGELLGYWKLAPADIEMLVRRLRWYQGWAKRPEQHSQELGALCGHL